MKANVKPTLLQWARQRAALTLDVLAKRLQVKSETVAEWERTGELTLKQIEKLATCTLTPVGYLFLPEPPVEKLPIPDFRTLGSQQLRRPSPELLETLHQCLRRQDWYREYAIANGAEPLPFIGNCKQSDGVDAVAASIRRTVGIDAQGRAGASNSETALRTMFELAEAAGIMVMRNGVVGNNNRRPLSVDEFRGFALSDEYAPLIFINAADTKAAQMFTLAHELAHLWVGESGISNPISTFVHRALAIETFCNRVAAETLVPLQDFRMEWRVAADPVTEFKRLAVRFRVSTLVIIRRAHDAGFLPEEVFQTVYDEEAKRLTQFARGSGGDFYKTQTSRLGRRFPKALLVSTLEGKTLYRDAFRLLGFSKTETFNQLAKELKFSI